MASTRLSSRSNMATGIVFSGRVCLTEFRYTRGYCWSKRHPWSYDAYPKSLKNLDTHTRSFGASDSIRSYHGRSKYGSSSYNYDPASLRGWRASSSWGRWTSNWDKSDRDTQAQLKEIREESAKYKRIGKDAADFYELVKRRIDTDPFNALFGRSFFFQIEHAQLGGVLVGLIENLRQNNKPLIRAASLQEPKHFPAILDIHQIRLT